MRYNVLFNLGYVEDSRQTHLHVLYATAEKKLSGSEIAKRFRDFLIKICRRNLKDPILRKCCLEQDKGNYCYECGSRLPVRDDDIIEEEIGIKAQELFCDIYNAPCVEISQDLVEDLREDGWILWEDLKSGPIFMINAFDRYIENPETVCLEIKSSTLSLKQWKTENE